MGHSSMFLEEAESIVTQAESVVSALLIAIQTQSKQCDDFKVLLSESREGKGMKFISKSDLTLASLRRVCHLRLD